MGPGMGVMSFSKSKAKIFAETGRKSLLRMSPASHEAKEELKEVG